MEDCGPVVTGDYNEPFNMDLRDWFAGQALAFVFEHRIDKPEAFAHKEWREVVAYEAYAMADAMLAAREK
jgi:hypothetical protein